MTRSRLGLTRAQILAFRRDVGALDERLGDESPLRRATTAVAPARFLPSGDPYFLLQGRDRELLVPEADRRRELWTPRVWPGGVLVEGEIVGTWRRSRGTVTVQSWRRLSRSARDAVEAEADTMPLPDVERIVVRWNDSRDGIQLGGAKNSSAVPSGSRKLTSEP